MQMATLQDWMKTTFRLTAITINIVGFQQRTGTLGKTDQPDVEKSRMMSSEFQMLTSLLPGKNSTKFQRVHLHLRGPASQWNSLKYYSSKPEVEKTEFKMPFSLQDKLIHPFIVMAQRLFKLK